MKKLITMALGLTLGTAQAYGKAGASIYNGQHLGIKGIHLMQMADDPNEFRWIPVEYKVQKESKTYIDEWGDERLIKVPKITHNIQNMGSASYSIYSFNVKLNKLSRIRKAKIERLLRTKHPGARLEGMAPICNMKLVAPSISVSTTDTSKGQLAYPIVQYGFSPGTDGDCAKIDFETWFPVRITVPMTLEPDFALNMVAGTGLVLPNVRVSHPYKYTDKVSVYINSRLFYDQVKNQSSISGGLFDVSAQVNNSISKALENLSVMGQFKMDVQNDANRTAYLQMVKDLITNLFVTFSQKEIPFNGAEPNFPSGCKPDPAKTVVKTAAGAPIPFCVSATFSKSEQDLERIKDISFNFQDTNYGTIYSDIVVRIKPVNVELISDDLKKLYPEQFQGEQE